MGYFESIEQRVINKLISYKEIYGKTYYYVTSGTSALSYSGYCLLNDNRTSENDFVPPPLDYYNNFFTSVFYGIFVGSSFMLAVGLAKPQIITNSYDYITKTYDYLVTKSSIEEISQDFEDYFDNIVNNVQSYCLKTINQIEQNFASYYDNYISCLEYSINYIDDLF